MGDAMKLSRIGSINGLYYFHIAAESGSFKKAAEQLFVTPAAVSQQISQLEARLERRLFQRSHRAIQLTEDGRRLYQYSQQAFSLLDQGLASLEADTNPGKLTITTMSSFASFWLVPRLGRFTEKYPDLSVMLLPTNQLEDFSSGEVDVAIRYGRGQYDNLNSELLMREEVYPVCHPEFLQRHPLQSPHDLKGCTLLGGQHGPSEGWKEWFAEQGITDIQACVSLHYVTSDMVVHGAIAQQGVALGRNSLVHELIRQGMLITPFPGRYASQFSYYFVCPEAHLKWQKVRLFLAWLKEEIQHFQNNDSLSVREVSILAEG